MKEGIVEAGQLVSLSNQVFLDDLLRKAKIGQLLATQAVRYLLTGADISFVPFGNLMLKGTSEQTALFLIANSNAFSDAASLHLRDQEFFDRLVETVKQNYRDESFGIEQLSKEMGVSERQLQRKVKALSNKSPVQLIQSVRLGEAKRLLETGEKSISEVAYLTGFSNPSYFAKTFKKEFGKSPSSISAGL